MPRVKRKKPYSPGRAHDRRSQDLPYNAEVAAIEVDDPLALEPGDKIVALRSIRNDPLGRLHSHRQIDQAQFRGGRAFQHDWRRRSAVRARSIPPANMSMVASGASRSPKLSAGRYYGSTASNANSAPTARCWCMRS